MEMLLDDVREMEENLARLDTECGYYRDMMEWYATGGNMPAGMFTSDQEENQKRLGKNASETPYEYRIVIGQQNKTVYIFYSNIRIKMDYQTFFGKPFPIKK